MLSSLDGVKYNCQTEQSSKMARIVQKYGGSSVGDTERMKRVAQRVKQYSDEGHQVVVVVSAMSGTTDQLIAQAKELHDNPSEREMDMLLATGEQQSVAFLAMAMHGYGCKAESFTGAQAGIETDGVHCKARIKNIDPERIERSLEKGNVVIVAGFQGASEEELITTLGRGGSDLTAVALAAALNADVCRIYSDVDGVYTADPRIVPEAQKIDRISHEEMLEMASLGTKVMQARAIEFARNFDVELEVRSSETDEPGTLITRESEEMEDKAVHGISLDKDEAKITISRVPDTPGIAARLFQVIADSSVNVDLIVQNVSEQGYTDISCTVPEADLPRFETDLAEKIRTELNTDEITSDKSIAKVSVVGVGMRTHSGIAATAFQALADADVNIKMIATSEIKISCVVPLDDASKAVRTLHQAFGLAEKTSGDE